jgi:hypothetical protein
MGAPRRRSVPALLKRNLLQNLASAWRHRPGLGTSNFGGRLIAFDGDKYGPPIEVYVIREVDP